MDDRPIPSGLSPTLTNRKGYCGYVRFAAEMGFTVGMPDSWIRVARNATATHELVALIKLASAPEESAIQSVRIAFAVQLLLKAVVAADESRFPFLSRTDLFDMALTMATGALEAK